MNLVTDVYDGQAPQGASVTLPYLIVDSWTLVPRDRMNALGVRVTFAIHVWTDYRGTKAGSAIETVLEDMFHQGQNRVVMPSDSPWAVITLHRTEAQYLQDGPLCHTVFRITAVLHRAPRT